MFTDSLVFKGKVTIQRIEELTNTLQEEVVINNLVVDAGKAWIIARMAGVPTAMSHMAVGTNATAAVVGNTTLGAEVARVPLASITVLGNKVTYVATVAAGTGTAGLTEAGILNALTNGTLLARTTFPVINKGAGDSISITWEITAP